MTNFIPAMTSKFLNNSGIDRYQVIQKLDTQISRILFSALNGQNRYDYSVFFDDETGSIRILENGRVILIRNTLTRKTQSTNVEQYRIDNTDELNGNYIFSKPNGRWILNLKNTPYTILYNPVPRNDMAYEYKNANDSGKSDILSKIIQSCIENNGKDPTCSCVNGITTNLSTPSLENDGEFCMTEIFNRNKALRRQVQFSSENKSVYGTLAGMCHCINQNCNKITNSFMREYIISNPCDKQLNLTICNTSIISDNAGQVNLGDLNIEQKCSSNTGPTPSPTPGPTPSPTPSPTPGPTPSPTPQISKKIFAGVFLIIIILLIILFYINKDD